MVPTWGVAAAAAAHAAHAVNSRGVNSDAENSGVGVWGHAGFEAADACAAKLLGCGLRNCCGGGFSFGFGFGLWLWLGRRLWAGMGDD